MEQLFIGKSFDHFDDFETLQNAYKTPFGGVKNADEERRSLCVFWAFFFSGNFLINLFESKE
ncbi:hypothetical protein BpHYR1_012811 [Brachionus plicatilis]|uniref:Uncharacterized protein n=1 Tax=Brachionus plicatilis TaxID=10195 RepID=A0A3M7RYP9_BRAPC|nr:hypothetical protein BpHYR1_012811 [Brachionus plicatilis]